MTKVPGLPAAVVKVGTLDEPSQFQPQLAIYTCDKQAFHQIPCGHAGFREAAPALTPANQLPPGTLSGGDGAVVRLDHAPSRPRRFRGVERAVGDPHQLAAARRRRRIR